MLLQKILIIDDDPEMVDNMQTRMEHFGFECFGFTTTIAALNALKFIHPDLILMDLGYANNGGQEFINQIQEFLGKEDNLPPVIVINGEQDYHVIEYAFDMGTMELFYSPYIDFSFGNGVSDYLPSEEEL